MTTPSTTNHRPSQSAAASLASMWLFVAACDAEAKLEPSASADAQAVASVAEVDAKAEGTADVKIEAKDFDLEAVAALVEEGTIESAAELEVIVNDEERGINHIDIDADGKIDHVQVVEVEGEADADVVLELRVIPSSSGSVDAAVVFATTTFVRHSAEAEVEIRTGFTTVVRQPEVRVYTHVVPVRIEAGVVVGGSVFLSWVFAVDRSIYVGVYTVDERGYWIPPGHAKHGHWKATGGRSSGNVHSKSHGNGKLVIGVHGGSSGKIKAKGGKGGKGGKGK